MPAYLHPLYIPGGFIVISLLEFFDNKLHEDNALLQLTTTLSMAYIVFYVSEGLYGTSGVIATVTLGMFFSEFSRGLIVNYEVLEVSRAYSLHLARTASRWREVGRRGRESAAQMAARRPAQCSHSLASLAPPSPFVHTALSFVHVCVCRLFVHTRAPPRRDGSALNSWATRWYSA